MRTFIEEQRATIADGMDVNAMRFELIRKRLLDVAQAGP